ncbi:hypothetical protein CQJ94_23050 [Glycomyces fuscus]|nr:hypothetical protein CQJ94_23050 [Glycomyces fuscus]
MPRTPEETTRRLPDPVLAKDTNVADLWAKDGTAEFPFAAGASPCRLVGFPEVYEVRGIPAITVQDGLITRLRGYWNPLANAAAAGALPELLDSPRSGADR